MKIQRSQAILTAVASLRNAAGLALFLAGSHVGMASEQNPPYGGLACEVDWINRSRFDAVASIESLQFMERTAERGELAAQLRLGLLRSTRDGKWSTPEDRSYNIKWLEKAATRGSRSASWELAQINFRRIPHEAFLRAAMEAAEGEGNPWAATHLMNLTNGRFGSDRKPTSCYEPWMVDHKCAPSEMLPISSARKWAEIAAEGGNAQAQEWLCLSAADGNAERGQPQDEVAALKWCRIAARNACAYRPLGRLETLLRKGSSGESPNSQEADRIKKLNDQPWRDPSGYFFAP